MPSSPENRKRRLAVNGLLSALSWFLPLLLAFLVTPIIVKGLGNEIYGLYAVVIGFISYSFTFGIGKTAAKFIAEYKAIGETEKIAEVVSTTFWFSLTIGLLGAVVIALTARPIVTYVLLISEDLRDNAVSALYLASAIVLATMLSTVFQYVLQGLHRFDRFVVLTNLSGILLNIGNVLIVWSGRGVLELLVWNLIVVSIIAVMFYLSARKLLPEFKFTFRIRPELRNGVLKYGSSIIVYQVFANIFLLFERGWIVRNFGSEALTFYVVPMTLGLYLHGFIASIVLVLFPVVNELLADRERLAQLYQKSSKLILFIIVFAVVTAIAGGKIFLAVWINEDFATRSYSILVIHMITFGLLAAGTIVWHVTESFRHAGLNALATFLWMAISIPLMVALSERMQTEGVAVARLIGVFVFIALILFAESRFIGGIFWGFWGSALWKIAVSAGATFVVEVEIFSRFQPGWASLIIGGLAGGLVYSAVILAVRFFSKDERNMLLQIISNKSGTVSA